MKENIEKAFADIRTRLDDKERAPDKTSEQKTKLVMTEWHLDCLEGRLQSLGILPGGTNGKR